MKQRMFNTFFKIVKNEYIAKNISNIAYWLLMFFYSICRLFMKGKITIDTKKARELVEKVSEKPNMKYTYIDKPTKKDLSIIVPAYNAESTINECIESVISQQTKYIYELIIINDGSSDSTKEKVESYNSKNIKLINQKNKGFSGARNRGLDECEGKYIMFLDSDDFLVDNCIEIMMNAIIKEDADIVQAGYYAFENKTKDKKRFTKFKKDIFIEKNKIVQLPGFPWAKIYNRNLLMGIRFPLGVWFEDTIVSMILYRKCNKVVLLDQIVYGYRLNPEGITQKARKSNKCIDHFWVMEGVLEIEKSLDLPNDELKYELICNHMSNLLYRRVSLMDEIVIQSLFILACEMLDEIRPQNYICNHKIIKKDIEKAFVTRNYKLWKLASFLV